MVGLDGLEGTAGHEAVAAELVLHERPAGKAVEVIEPGVGNGGSVAMVRVDLAVDPIGTAPGNELGLGTAAGSNIGVHARLLVEERLDTGDAIVDGQLVCWDGFMLLPMVASVISSVACWLAVVATTSCVAPADSFASSVRVRTTLSAR